MSIKFNDQFENAKNVVQAAQQGTSSVASGARSALMDGIHVVSGVAAMLRSLGVHDALGWVGLARRRSPLAPFAAFGAGCIAGLGVGMLVAPKAGIDTRRAILRYLTGGKTGGDVLEQAESDAAKLADKATSAAKKVEHKVDESAEAMKDAAKSKLAGATTAVEDAQYDAKSLMSANGTGGRTQLG